MSTDPVASHGRGGVGNIAPDANTYLDGEIVREGPVGDQGNGAYSAGRGGAGNIESQGVKPKSDETGDRDVIPETATRPGGGYENFHVGRGGEGNVHKNRAIGHEKEGFVEKLKHPLHGGEKKA